LTVTLREWRYGDKQKQHGLQQFELGVKPHFLFNDRSMPDAFVVHRFSSDVASFYRRASHVDHCTFFVDYCTVQKSSVLTLILLFTTLSRLLKLFNTHLFFLFSLVGKLEGKKPLGRPRHRWEDSINERNEMRCPIYEGVPKVSGLAAWSENCK
jgi:hypothetical protein